jgi:DNA-binding GntR family transcriptional regulator
VLKGIVQRLNTPIHHLVFETFYRRRAVAGSVQDHRLVVDAVLAGDVEAAERTMRAPRDQRARIPLAARSVDTFR